MEPHFILDNSSITFIINKVLLFQLRLLRQEIGIEEIVHKRVTKAFYERCRDYYNMEN